MIMIRLISLTFACNFLKKNKKISNQRKTKAKTPNNFNMMMNNNGMKKYKNK